MNGPEHYRKAEGLIENAWKRVGRSDDLLHSAEVRDRLIANAQVHATLALTAATVAAHGNTRVSRDWREATS